ncbi:hypothetical protein COA18_11930 [Priestia megaterium]|nr:hypothetical protein COA18_11930 [Priestia megaterium]
MGYTVLAIKGVQAKRALSRRGQAGDFAAADGSFAGRDGLESFFAWGAGTPGVSDFLCAGR